MKIHEVLYTIEQKSAIPVKCQNSEILWRTFLHENF